MSKEEEKGYGELEIRIMPPKPRGRHKVADLKEDARRTMLIKVDLADYDRVKALQPQLRYTRSRSGRRNGSVVVAKMILYTIPLDRLLYYNLRTLAQIESEMGTRSQREGRGEYFGGCEFRHRNGDPFDCRRGNIFLYDPYKR